MLRDHVAEAELIRRLQQGDRTAAAAIVRAYQTALYRYALRFVGRPAIAEELCQESLVRLFSSAKQLEPKRGLYSWLFRIHVNVCKDYLKRKEHEYSSTMDNGQLEAAAYSSPTAWRAPNGEELASRAELRASLAKSVDALAPMYREALLLKDVEELNYSEMSTITGEPVTTLKMRVRRARERLARIVESDGEVVDLNAVRAASGK